MAGQRQYTKLVSLFDNWDQYTRLLNTSLESQGTTMEKNSRYMESLEAHLNQLGAAGERVKTAMIDSDSFKGLVDFGTQAVTMFANFIEAIGGGGNALLTLGSIAGNVFGNVIAKEIDGFVTNMKKGQENAQKLAADIQMTEKIGKLEGFSAGAVKSMVDAKKQAQLYYNVLSEGQINEYQGLVKNLGQLETKKKNYNLN